MDDYEQNNVIKDSMLAFNTTIGTISIFAELIMGITELTIAIIYHEYFGQCQSLWELILTSGIINILLFSTIGYDFYQMFWNNNNNQINHFGILLCNIILFVPNSWAVYIYNNITDQCKNYWTHNANEIWILLMIHYYLFWSIISFMSLLFVGCCGYCMTRCCDNNRPKIVAI